MECAWTFDLFGWPRGSSGRSIGQSKTNKKYSKNFSCNRGRVLGDIVSEERVVLVLKKKTDSLSKNYDYEEGEGGVKARIRTLPFARSDHTFNVAIRI